MSELIPLSQIPTPRARGAERDARAQFATRAEALRAARIEILDAPGVGNASHGWVITPGAAEALAGIRVSLFGGTTHAVYDYAVR